MRVLELCKKYGMSNPTDIRHFEQEVDELIQSLVVEKINEIGLYELLNDIAYPRRNSVASNWTLEDVVSLCTDMLSKIDSMNNG